MRSISLGLLGAVVACGCVSVALTPEGGRVSVYTASLDGPAAGRAMPDGCGKVAVVISQNRMSELDMDQDDPFRKQRNGAAAGGGNVLLVLKPVVSPRIDFECPNAVPIRDCAPSSGAWYTVEFESYACSAEALRTLNIRK